MLHRYHAAIFCSHQHAHHHQFCTVHETIHWTTHRKLEQAQQSRIHHLNDVRKQLMSSLYFLRHFAPKPRFKREYDFLLYLPLHSGTTPRPCSCTVRLGSHAK